MPAKWSVSGSRLVSSLQIADHERVSKTVDEYLAGRPPDQRTALERIRREVRKLIPGAVEAMSYGMPVFKIGDQAVVWFAGWKGHCSIYPLTDGFLRSHATELEGFKRTRGSLHFTPDRPIPDALLGAFVQARLADLELEPTRGR